MKIHIPTIQEKENEKKESNDVNTTDTTDLTEKYISKSSGLSNNSESIKDEKSKNNTKVNINIATQTQLETLTGIGPTIAMKIIEYRKEHGNFKQIEDIKNVSGIGDSKFEKIKEFITVK